MYTTKVLRCVAVQDQIDADLADVFKPRWVMVLTKDGEDVARQRCPSWWSEETAQAKAEWWAEVDATGCEWRLEREGVELVEG